MRGPEEEEEEEEGEGEKLEGKREEKKSTFKPWQEFKSKCKQLRPMGRDPRG
jgi:hypothetical protein